MGTTARNKNIKTKAMICKSYAKLTEKYMSDELKEIGNYKILKLIGQGTFGDVYLASHILTKRKVVLKAADRKDANVVREAFYHRQFEFPFIARLYEIILTENKIWLVLEYCSGHDLYDYVVKRDFIPKEDCKRLFCQIATAVYYGHSLNCVHRDLKLENILLDKDRNAKLTDYGFTRDCSQNSQLETICGTISYMAPELILKKKYQGFKVDIWALGVILYALITGALPFGEETDGESRMKLELNIVNNIPYFGTDMDPLAKDLILSMLEKNPNERPSIQEVLRHEFLQPEGQKFIGRVDTLLEKQSDKHLKFSTKMERDLLHKLEDIGFDIKAIKKSVRKKKCDANSGLWLLLIEKYKEEEKEKEINLKNNNAQHLSLAHKDYLNIPILESSSDCYTSSESSNGTKTISSKSNDSSAVKVPSNDSSFRKSSKLNIGSSTSKKSNGPHKSSDPPKKSNLFGKISDFFRHKTDTHKDDKYSNNDKLDVPQNDYETPEKNGKTLEDKIPPNVNTDCHSDLILNDDDLDISSIISPNGIFSSNNNIESQSNSPKEFPINNNKLYLRNNNSPIMFNLSGVNINNNNNFTKKVYDPPSDPNKIQPGHYKLPMYYPTAIHRGNPRTLYINKFNSNNQDAFKSETSMISTLSDQSSKSDSFYNLLTTATPNLRKISNNADMKTIIPKISASNRTSQFKPYSGFDPKDHPVIQELPTIPSSDDPAEYIARPSQTETNRVPGKTETVDTDISQTSEILSSHDSPQHVQYLKKKSDSELFNTAEYAYFDSNTPGDSPKSVSLAEILSK